MMYNSYYWPNHYYSMGFGFNLFSFILTVLFWWLIIVLIIKLVKSAHRCNHDHYKHNETDEEDVEENNNLKIVKERYAKGEINKKEYEQLTKDLG